MSRVECDKKLCSGCLACVVACMDQHYDETEVDAVSPRIYEESVFDALGVRYHNAIAMYEIDGTLKYKF